MVTPRERRTIALGVVLACVAWLLLRGAPLGWAQLTTARTAAARAALQFARDQRLVQRATLIAEEQRHLELRRAALAERTLHECDGAICVDDAQSAIEDALVDLPIAVEAIEASFDSVQHGGLRRVLVNLRIETDANGLAEVFTALRQQPLRLELSELLVEAADPGEAEDVERLRVSLTVGAWAATRTP